jgi:hypothetical protein
MNTPPLSQEQLDIETIRALRARIELLAMENWELRSIIQELRGE